MALVSSGTSGEPVEIEVLKQSHQVKVVDQEEPTKIGDTTTDNEEIPITEQKHLTEDIKEARVDSDGESNNESQETEVGEEKGENIIENQNVEFGKVQASQATEKKPAGKLKKAKAVGKHKHQLVPTIPQPFSLATEKRMARDRQSTTLQAKESKSKFTKSVSLNLKVDTEITTGIKQSAELKCGVSVITRSTLARNSAVEKRPEGWAKLRETVRGKVMDSKKPQTNAKDGEETKLNKLKQSSTFKASPLPSFYHRKVPPPKPHPNKVPVTHPRSPQLGRQNKSSSEGVDTNKKDIKRNASGTLSVTTKETLHKLFKGVRKAPSSQQEKVLKNSSSISHKSAIKEEKV